MTKGGRTTSIHWIVIALVVLVAGYLLTRKGEEALPPPTSNQPPHRACPGPARHPAGLVVSGPLPGYHFARHLPQAPRNGLYHERQLGKMDRGLRHRGHLRHCGRSFHPPLCQIRQELSGLDLELEKTIRTPPFKKSSPRRPHHRDRPRAHRWRICKNRKAQTQLSQHAGHRGRHHDSPHREVS